MTKRPENQPTPAKIGRPLTDPVDRLRTRIWYNAVKARGGWSDYQLDIEFARNEDEPRPTGPERTRAFEQIRREGTVPSPGTHPRRSYDLVQRVESHPEFRGTAGYFNSRFWDIVRAGEMSLQEAHAFVSDLMATCQIYRPSANSYDLIFYLAPAEVLAAIHASDQRRNLYDGCLTAVISKLPLNLDTLALIGSLFREAYLVSALEVATTLSNQLLRLLERFSLQDWLDRDVGTQFLQLAEQRIIHWQMRERFPDEGIYDDWPPAVVMRPLLAIDANVQWMIDHEAVIEDVMSAERKAAVESIRLRESQGKF